MNKNIYFLKTLKDYFTKLKSNKIDKNIQQIYDHYKYGYDFGMDQELLYMLVEYNSKLDEPYFATGQNSYYNEQIEQNGLSNLRLKVQDIEDANYIATSFGKKPHSSSNNSIPIIYTTLLGTTEFNYASQSFPASIFEDVFGCSADHSLPIQPIVGESEQDYYLRVMEYQIDNSPTFIKENKEEVLLRTKRLINSFCKGKNRVYLISVRDLLNLKCSFGDINGLRDRSLSEKDAMKIVESLQSVGDMLSENFILQTRQINPSWLYNNPNLKSEYGVAIYDKISPLLIKYIEVERMYDMIQRKAIDLGYQKGDLIPTDIQYQRHKLLNSESFQK